MAPTGVELADHADAGLRPEVSLQLQRGIQPGATGADDDRVQLVDSRRRNCGAPGHEGHENGPVGGAVSGLKKAITAMPSTSHTTLMTSRMPTSRLRPVRLVT